MNSISQTTFVFLITIVLSSIAFILVMFLQERKSRYNDRETYYAEISQMRSYFEKQLYDMTNRLLSTEERWRDVNHLLLSSQKIQNDEKLISSEVQLSEFLKCAGIQESDLEIDKNLVFVLTPFNQNYFPVYETIQRICNQVGFKCLRGDEEYIQGNILGHILSLIVKANIIIANIDGRNPNVFYELGLAHAMNKQVILLAKTMENVPIDVKSKRIIIYGSQEDLTIRLKDELLKVLAKK